MSRAVVAALALLLSALCWASEPPRLAADALVEKTSRGEDVVLLDVRTSKEFAEGHIPGAVNISHDELGSRLDELGADRDREIVVYCRSGRRADVALDLLAKAGFRRLYHLDGDYLGWAEANRSVEK